jgi:hypothetical protein
VNKQIRLTQSLHLRAQGLQAKRRAATDHERTIFPNTTAANRQLNPGQQKKKKNNSKK